MDRLHIYIIGAVFLIYIIMLLLSIKNSYRVDDDFEFLDDDGDHIYYDRKLILHKATTKIQK